MNLSWYYFKYSKEYQCIYVGIQLLFSNDPKLLTVFRVVLLQFGLQLLLGVQRFITSSCKVRICVVGELLRYDIAAAGIRIQRTVVPGHDALAASHSDVC